MTIQEYQELANRTLNPDISHWEQVINGVMGLCGESGECIDILKKHLYQGHDKLDREHLTEELGDVAWYLACTAYGLGVPLEKILQDNIDKLKKRYPQGFSAERSIYREEYTESGLLEE